MKHSSEIYGMYYDAWWALQNKKANHAPDCNPPGPAQFAGATEWCNFFQAIHDGKIDTDFAKALKAKIAELRLTR